MSFVGNRGTFQFSINRMFNDKDLLLHLNYFTFAVLGFTVHEFFYCILVGIDPEGLEVGLALVVVVNDID